jgi:hypothetical protein
MTVASIFNLAGRNLNVGWFLGRVTGGDPHGNGLWEMDTSMSIVTLVLLLAGVVLFLRNPRKNLSNLISGKRWVACFLLILSTVIVVEFILSKGLVYDHMHRLPFMRSLHMNVRYTSALIFPCALLASIIFNRWQTAFFEEKRFSLILFLAVDAIVLMSLLSYFSFKGDLQARTFDITKSIDTYNSILTGERFEVERIAEERGDESLVFKNHLSSRYPYEPIFGYSLENFRSEVSEGSVWNRSGIYYNMTNPAGLVFPDVNAVRPFERIRTSDKAKLAAFVSRHQPEWALPTYQKVFNWISGFTFMVILAILGGYGVGRIGKRIRSREVCNG